MTQAPPTLQASGQPLVERYDSAMLDLDGVVYRGKDGIEGVAIVLDRARAAGLTLAFVTNNASSPPAAVADKLRGLGVAAHASDVVTSAQAAAREVAKLVPKGAAVLVVGGDGLETALRERNLRPVTSLVDRPSAVVQGFHPDVGWRQLAQAAYAVAAGLPWVASNLDLTVPTADGIAPGNGTFVNAVAAAVGRRPEVVAGKPYRPLFDETVLRIGATAPIVVGDRLDTDIAGANLCGADSLLVMTGVTDLAELCRAEPKSRPSYVAWTLDGLLARHESPIHRDATWRLGTWSVTLSEGALIVGEHDDDRNSGLRAVTAAAWAWYDRRRRDETVDLDISAAVDVLRRYEPAPPPCHT